MSRLLVLDPHPVASEPWRHAVLALGCPADATHDRDTLMRWLMRAARQGQLGLVLIVDESPLWRAHDVVREIRRLPLPRQVPVLVMQGQTDELLPPDGRFPANATVALDAPPQQLMLALALLLGRPAAALFRMGRFLPEGNPWRSQADYQAELRHELQRLWELQQLSLTLPQLAAGALAGVRDALEHLLANRVDDLALPAARALLRLSGGSRPLAQWAARYAPPAPPAQRQQAPALPQRPALLVAPGGRAEGAVATTTVAAQRLRVLLLRAAQGDVAVPSNRIGRAFWWDPAAAAPHPAEATGTDLAPFHVPEPDDDTRKARQRARRSPLCLLALLGESTPNSQRAGLWLELGEVDGRQVIAPVDDVLAYATLDWQPQPDWLRTLTGLMGSAQGPGGAPLRLLDLPRLLRRPAAAAVPLNCSTGPRSSPAA